MSRKYVLGLALVAAASVVAGNSYAQTYYRSGSYGSAGCPCQGGVVGGTVVQPAPAGQAAPAAQPGTVQQGAVQQGAVTQQSPVMQQGVVMQQAPTRYYRRFSYTPAPTGAVQGGAAQSYAPAYRYPGDTLNYRSGGGYSRNLGNMWQYPKGDPRRQMH